MLYHLEFARRYKTRTHSIVGRLYHTDAVDQNSFVPNASHWLRVAPDMARTMKVLLREHGRALRLWAPSSYTEDLRTAGKFAFLAHQRSAGLAYSLRALARAPLSLKAWAILFFGVVGPNALAAADAKKMEVRRLRALESARAK